MVDLVHDQCPKAPILCSSVNQRIEHPQNQRLLDDINLMNKSYI